MNRTLNRRCQISILLITLTAIFYYKLMYKDSDFLLFNILDKTERINGNRDEIMRDMNGNVSTEIKDALVLEEEDERLNEIVLLDNTTCCKMLKLDPFDKKVWELRSKPKKITCYGIDWVKCYLTKCWVVQKILDKFEEIVCLYEAVIYVRDSYYYLVEPVVVNGSDQYTFNRSDHVKVTCSAKEIGFGVVVPKWIGYKAGFRPLPPKPSQFGNEKALNVMILCFDSTSHNYFKRTMPKSYKILTEELKAVALNSYNIVEDRTSANMFPIMTGKHDFELPDTRRATSKRKIDPKWLIFHLLHQVGYAYSLRYRTAYLEDWPKRGTFQYQHNGFPYQPTDHYLRAFLLEESKKNRRLSHDGYKDSYCVGAIPRFKLLLNLTEQFFHLDGKKFCFTIISDISQDDINFISVADDDVAEFLSNFKAQGRLEDTLLVVMGGDRSRRHEIRTLYQGRMDERLPLMTIVLPNQFKKERPKAEGSLRSNVDVLTTPFDIHTTLLDYVGLKQFRNLYKTKGTSYERGLSLFNSIPKTRSCSEAGVMVHWCACSHWIPVPKEDRMYQLVPNVLAGFINNITNSQSSLCVNKALVHIKWVMKLIKNEAVLRIPENNLSNPNGSTVLPRTEYYQTRIIMDPGRSHYEGTVGYRTMDDYFIISRRYVSRTDAYGKQSACVSATHPYLQKYCYCKDYSP